MKVLKYFLENTIATETCFYIFWDTFFLGFYTVLISVSSKLNILDATASSFSNYFPQVRKKCFHIFWSERCNFACLWLTYAKNFMISMATLSQRVYFHDLRITSLFASAISYASLLHSFLDSKQIILLQVVIQSANLTSGSYITFGNILISVSGLLRFLIVIKL